MDIVGQAGVKTRKHRPVLRIVLIVLALAAIAEPVLMYRHLVRQREERRAAAESAGMVPLEFEAGR